MQHVSSYDIVDYSQFFGECTRATDTAWLESDAELFEIDLRFALG